MRPVLMLALVMAALGCNAQATDNSPAAPAMGRNQVGGTVLETLDASSYTYIRFRTPDGEAWAAVPQTRLEPGTQVVIANPQLMSGFQSQTLERTFDTIYFGTLEGQGPSAPKTVGMNPHGSIQGGAEETAAAGSSAATSVEVARAEGATGRTIEQLYAEKNEFAGKTVALRGKVVKYNAGIMGRNWIHLQDGTGDAAAGTNDITVTTSDTATLGETVLVQGTVTLDKDFGSGYRYAVIVEEASVN